MSIIIFLCMCQPDELPPTATKMYASFILHTVCHHLKRVGKIPEDYIVNKLEQFPLKVYKALEELEKVAFKGIVKDKIIFTVEELPVLCRDDPTCYGLLQSTECYSAIEVGASTQSFNFLHLGIQEYFAAKYVTTLSEDEVYTLLRESFIVSESLDSDSKSVRLSNMWICYCGITSGQCKTLKNYLTTFSNQKSSYGERFTSSTGHSESYQFLSNDNTLSDSSIVLFQNSNNHSFTSPAKRDTSSRQLTSRKMTGPPQQGLSFDQNCYISNTGNIAQEILKDPVKVLYLFQCFEEAQDTTLCKVLSQSFDNGVIDISDHRLLPHQVVSLGFFLSRSCRKWKELNLTNCNFGEHSLGILHQYLRGDNANKQEITKINLSKNTLTETSLSLIGDIISHNQLPTLQLHSHKTTHERDISNAVVTTSTVKVLCISDSNITVHNAKPISDMMIYLQELKVNNNRLEDNGINLLSGGIRNSKTLRVLDISSNNIGLTGTAAIADALTNNTSLEELYLSYNIIGDDEAILLSDAILQTNTLRILDISSNNIALSGTAAIASALINNTSLEELCISHNKIGNDEAVLLSDAISQTKTLRILNISSNNIAQSGTTAIANALISNTSLEELCISHNKISNDEAVLLSDAISQTKTLRILNISSNNIGSSGIAAIANALTSNTSLEELYMSRNKIGDNEALLLSDAISQTKTLRILNISRNYIGSSGITAIANALVKNTSLEHLYMGDNKIGPSGATAIAEAIVSNNKLKSLSLCYDHTLSHEPLGLDNEVDKESSIEIIRSLCYNNTVTELSIPIKLHKYDIHFVTEEVATVNNQRKIFNKPIVNCHIATVY